MILVDTSIWIDHLRQGDPTLAGLLNADQVYMHPFIIGEIALGKLPRRASLLRDLMDLPMAAPATPDEVLSFIEGERLHGLGIGYVDAHLLAATRLSPDAALWTRDRRLGGIATRLGLAASV